MRGGVAHAVHPGSVGESVHGLVAVGGHRGVGGVGPRHLVHHPGDAQVVGDLETLGQTALIIASHGGQMMAWLAARHGALRPCRGNVDEIYLSKYRAWLTYTVRHCCLDTAVARDCLDCGHQSSVHLRHPCWDWPSSL